MRQACHVLCDDLFLTDVYSDRSRVAGAPPACGTAHTFDDGVTADIDLVPSVTREGTRYSCKGASLICVSLCLDKLPDSVLQPAVQSSIPWLESSGISPRRSRMTPTLLACSRTILSDLEQLHEIYLRICHVILAKAFRPSPASQVPPAPKWCYKR